ncbi:Mu transposase C-terminal domain-containing protein [Bacillus sp. OV166]|uniref:Mu transposase C-terminal domain-containing protein n=1 Tax=Bacillus sp. OV166 TaxID=1882763 RepID=UPI00358FF462
MELNKGLKINGLFYMNNLFNNQNYDGKVVPIRYDPINIDIAYAYLEKNWITLHSSNENEKD